MKREGLAHPIFFWVGFLAIPVTGLVFLGACVYVIAHFLAKVW